MKSLVLVSSKTGNTYKIARYVQKGFGCAMMDFVNALTKESSAVFPAQRGAPRLQGPCGGSGGEVPFRAALLNPSAVGRDGIPPLAGA